MPDLGQSESLSKSNSNSKKKKNLRNIMVDQRTVGCVLSGVVFAVAWWIFIDGVVFGETIGNAEKFEPYYVIPGIGATIALVMLNCVKLEDAMGSGGGDSGFGSDGSTRTTIVRAWLFIWFTIMFVCIAGAIWTMAAHYSDNWTGVAILVQPIVISASAGLLLYTRKSPGYEIA
jgi:Uncharacterised protein family (UPF0220)